jgi:hypothetical protein
VVCITDEKLWLLKLNMCSLQDVVSYKVRRLSPTLELEQIGGPTGDSQSILLDFSANPAQSIGVARYSSTWNSKSG